MIQKIFFAHYHANKINILSLLCLASHCHLNLNFSFFDKMVFSCYFFLQHSGMQMNFLYSPFLIFFNLITVNSDLVTYLIYVGRKLYSRNFSFQSGEICLLEYPGNLLGKTPIKNIAPIKPRYLPMQYDLVLLKVLLRYAYFLRRSYFRRPRNHVSCESGSTYYRRPIRVYVTRSRGSRQLQ